MFCVLVLRRAGGSPFPLLRRSIPFRPVELGSVLAAQLFDVLWGREVLARLGIVLHALVHDMLEQKPISSHNAITCMLRSKLANAKSLQRMRVRVGLGGFAGVL